jgi:hypothetical protein
MRKLIPILIVGLLGLANGFAQEITLTAPVVRNSGTKYTITLFVVSTTPATANIEIALKDAGNVEISRVMNVIPDPAHAGATVAGLVTAMVTVRATETGSDVRKMQFRVLGYLNDQGYLPAGTLTP